MAELSSNSVTVPYNHHSLQNPYHQAIYLSCLIKAAVSIIDGLDLPPEAAKAGLNGLLTVIDERALDLEKLLDHPEFCENWKAE